jgi:Carboxyltransferase domain, subdomain A and B
LHLYAHHQNLLQDWPGRVKLWNVGVPPSGPMDMYTFRFANALVGNAPSAAGLEFAIQGVHMIRPACCSTWYSLCTETQSWCPHAFECWHCNVFSKQDIFFLQAQQ